jgi:pimeloyl-ACP methyl ester carboxylesterase
MKRLFLNSTVLIMAFLLGGCAWIFSRISNHSHPPVEKIYTGTSVKQRNPILLVHGLYRTGKIWMASGGRRGRVIPGARSMVEALQVSGYPNIYVNTFSDTRKTRFLDNANELKGWIDKAKKIFKARAVDIIAHSLGGLISRAYLQEIDFIDGSPARSVSYGNDVGKLIMIATPHLGSPLADSFENIFDWYSVRTLKEGGGPDLRLLNKRTIPCMVAYYSIVVSTDKSPRPARWSFWRFMRFLLSYSAPGDGDGVVGLKSQNFKSVGPSQKCFHDPYELFLVSTRKGFSHRSAVMSPSVQEVVLKILDQKKSRVLATVSEISINPKS